MPGAEYWYTDSDTCVEIVLQDAVSEAYINAGTVTGQLEDADGTPVGGAVTLSYVAGSNGRYAGVVPNTLTLTAGAWYTLVVTCGSGVYILVGYIRRMAKRFTL